MKAIKRGAIGVAVLSGGLLLSGITLHAAETVSLDLQVLSVRGVKGSQVTIQWADSLQTSNGWQTLAELVLGSNSPTVVDHNTNGNQRYYRALVSTNLPAPAGMVLIPDGSFQMGDTLDGRDEELPVHSVHVSACYMDKYEVSMSQWDTVAQWATNHGYSFDYYATGKTTNHPAQNMSWHDAVNWCNARSEMEGATPAYYTDAAQTSVYRAGQVDIENGWVNWNAGYRLPTEAEWERAARGGRSGNRFSWGDTITHSQDNYYSDSSLSYDISPTRAFNPAYSTSPSPYTNPVGTFGLNNLGLYEMTGNVKEWCWDWFGSYSSASLDNPRGPASGSYRVTRGGHWGASAIECRVSFRQNFSGAHNDATGFRCVRPL